MYCSLRCVGSAHDAISYSVSNLARFLRNGGLPLCFWIAGDDAYECIDSIITPIPRRRAPLGSRKDAF